LLCFMKASSHPSSSSPQYSSTPPLSPPKPATPASSASAPSPSQPPPPIALLPDPPPCRFSGADIQFFVILWCPSEEMGNGGAGAGVRGSWPVCTGYPLALCRDWSALSSCLWVLDFRSLHGGVEQRADR
jgi:hypothetical protein